MYYPFLRGRQNELIALRTLSENGLLGNVVPVIEPVKASSTLLKTLETLADEGDECFVVLNPSVGLFEREIQLSPSYEEKFRSLMKRGEGSLRPCLRLSDDMAQFAMQDGLDEDHIALIFDINHADVYTSAVRSGISPSPVFIADRFRRHARRADKVLLEDHFNAKERNSDYRNCVDEFFSEDHLFYREEGYCGFGDYSIVGSRFSEGGFQPKTVAIHCVYEDGPGGPLRVHHALSAEDAPHDAAALYHSALGELVNWAEAHELLSHPTLGLQQLLDSFEHETFPGLGMAKRLSVMHHLELVSRLLGGER